MCINNDKNRRALIGNQGCIGARKKTVVLFTARFFFAFFGTSVLKFTALH